MATGSNPLTEDTIKNIHYHLEHIVPGVLLLVAIYPYLSFPSNPGIIEQAFLSICMAYLLGVVAFVSSRMLFDRFSWKFIHPTAFFIFARKKFQKNGNKCKWWRDFVCNADRIEKEYNKVRSESETDGNPFRTQQVNERRFRIRMVRSTIIPVALLIGLHITPSFGNSIRILLGFVAGAFMLVLFAYGEVSIFEEAIADRNDVPINLG